MLHKIDSTQKPSLYSDVRNLNVSQSKTRYIRKRDLAMGFSDFSVPMISVVASSVRMSKPLQVSQCKFSHLTLLTVGLYSRPRTPSTAIQQILSLRCTPTITAASRNYNNIAECRCRQHLRALASRRAMHQSTRLPQCVASAASVAAVAARIIIAQVDWLTRPRPPGTDRRTPEKRRAFCRPQKDGR